MTPDKTCSAAGLPGGIPRMMELTGVPRRTLIDWHNNPKFRERFDKILKLCVEFDKKQDDE